MFDVGAVVLLFLTFAFGAGALITGRVIDRRKEAQIKQFDKDLTDAKIELGKQEERAANAERAASALRKDAEEAKLATEKLKQVVAWRVIEPKAAVELEKILSTKPGSVNLRYTDGDPEALFLAIQISQILGKAKWQIAPGSEKFANAIEFGIALPDSTGADAQTLRKAFLGAKLSFTTAPLPPQGISFNVATIPGAPTLMIGSRMPVHIP